MTGGVTGDSVTGPGVERNVLVTQVIFQLEMALVNQSHSESGCSHECVSVEVVCMFEM